MSRLYIKNEMHDAVESFMEFCGEPQDAYILHEEIDNPAERSWLYDVFLEFLND